MNCPQCKDHEENSETYAFNRLSPEAATAADKYAIEQLLKVPKPRPTDLDLYMMYYRIEYERISSSEKHKYLSEYAQLICTKYKDCSDLCAKCKEPKIDYFNDKISFCFHEIPYDPKCENCKLKS